MPDPADRRTRRNPEPSTDGSRTRPRAMTGRRSAAPTSSTKVSSASRSRRTTRSITSPESTARDHDTRIDAQTDQGLDQRRMARAQCRRRCHSLLGRRHRLQAQRDRARRSGRSDERRHPADLHQQGAGGPRRGAAGAVQPALRGAHHRDRRAGRPSGADRAQPRRHPACGTRTATTASPATCSTSSSSARRPRRRSPAASNGSICPASAREFRRRRHADHRCRPRRSYTPKSASIGLIQNLPWDLVGSITAQYVERAPKPAELFSGGGHDATATFDKGNPNLKIEAAQSIEVGLRRAKGPFRFEATAYYTKFKGFIYRRLTGNTCDERYRRSADRAPANSTRRSIRRPTRSSAAANSRASGTCCRSATGMFGIENQFDVVRATFTDGSNVPRIPPVRIGGGVYLARRQLARARQAAARLRAEQYRRHRRDADARLRRSARGAELQMEAGKACRRRTQRSVGRHQRQQSAQPRHPQQRVLFEGRSADAGRQRAAVRDVKY